MGIDQRIRRVRKEHGLKVKDFAVQVGIKPPYVSEIEHGKKIPSERVVELICLKFNVNKTWLLTGEGPKYVEEEGIKTGEPKLEYSSSPATQKILEHLEHMSEEKRREILTHIQEKELLGKLLKKEIK